jgi:drug/metabolite transporter (DMT)-like permease
MIPMGLSFAMMTSTFLTSMVLGSESNTIWLQYLAPVWVLIAGKWGWTDPPHVGDRVLIAAAIGGLSWILFFELSGGRPASTILAIVSGWSFAIVLICLRQLRDENGPWLLFISHCTTAVCLAPFALTQVPLPSPFQLSVLLLFAVIQLGLPYLLFTWGLKSVSSQEAALLSLLEPITLPIWTFIAWHHHADYSAPNWWTIVGATMIACGFVWKYGKGFHRPQRNDDPETVTH